MFKMSSSEEEEKNFIVKEEAIEDISSWKPIRSSAFSPYRVS